MAVRSIRLPERLDASASVYAEYLGISVNALVCFALDAYLQPRSVPVDTNPGQPDPAAPEGPALPPLGQYPADRGERTKSGNYRTGAKALNRMAKGTKS